MLVKILKETVDKFHCSLGLLGIIIFFHSPIANSSEALLQQYCLACHTLEAKEPLKISRISHQRKTPEGWLMSIARMQTVHGLKITSEDRAALVKHLSNNQGLTPVEALPYRYILERSPNYSENLQPEIGEMCARCHSEARIGLQRRDESEWKHLVNFHLGQWPSIEYSAMGRDRHWFEVAINEVAPFLGEKYSLDLQKWLEWKTQAKAEVNKKWRIVGNMPGKGDFQGHISLSDAENDTYGMKFNGTFNNGEQLKGEGQVIVYSGFEWRGSLTINEENYQQVFALNETGNELKGRMFINGHDEIGLNLAGSVENESKILALSPNYIKAGTVQEISVRGTNLKGNITLGDGFNILEESVRTANEIVIKVQAPSNIKFSKASIVSVGHVSKAKALVLYKTIDEVKVFPSYAIARVGEGGGDQPIVNATFQVKAFAAGEDGKLATTDDVYIGLFPAKWSVAPFDAQAIEDEDVKFAGNINVDTGVFTPNEAGPNPERRYGTNNVGHLSIIAKVKDDKNTLKANAELIVTVQRWNNPPIR